MAEVREEDVAKAVKAKEKDAADVVAVKAIMARIHPADLAGQVDPADKVAKVPVVRVGKATKAPVGKVTKALVAKVPVVRVGKAANGSEVRADKVVDRAVGAGKALVGPAALAAEVVVADEISSGRHEEWHCTGSSTVGCDAPCGNSSRDLCKYQDRGQNVSG